MVGFEWWWTGYLQTHWKGDFKSWQQLSGLRVFVNLTPNRPTCGCRVIRPRRTVDYAVDRSLPDGLHYGTARGVIASAPVLERTIVYISGRGTSGRRPDSFS